MLPPFFISGTARWLIADDSSIVLPCDVTDDESIDAVFEAIRQNWGSLDFLVHAIAYADKETCSMLTLRRSGELYSFQRRM